MELGREGWRGGALVGEAEGMGFLGLEERVGGACGDLRGDGEV